MTKQQFNPEKYAQYLKEKIEFLERQVERLMSRYDRGGTMALFPTYDEWMESGNPFKRGR